MKFLDFFDPLNIEHLRAYRHLQRKGSWPEGFITNDMAIEFEINWQMELQFKMADLWVGTNIFMSGMNPEALDKEIDLGPLLKIAEDFDKKMKENL